MMIHSFRKLFNLFKVIEFVWVLKLIILFRLKKFNSSYNVIGDFDYFIHSSFKYNIKAIQEPLAIYRIHSDNCNTVFIEVQIGEYFGEDDIVRIEDDYNR